MTETITTKLQNDGKAATRNDGNIGNITQQIKDLAGNTTHMVQATNMLTAKIIL